MRVRANRRLDLFHSNSLNILVERLNYTVTSALSIHSTSSYLVIYKVTS